MTDEGRTRKVERPIDIRPDDIAEDRPFDPEDTRKIDSRLRRLDTPPPLPGIEPPTHKVDSGRTQIYRGAKRTPASTEYHPLSPSGNVEDAEPMQDPVVGWLVVVKGPGRGQAVRIGSEWNSIGRDPDQRICLNFGDNHISRRNHAKLNYEPIARKFSITIGDGINSTYVRGENLLGPTELKASDRIRIGETELLFVPLCGDNFDWNGEQ
jgi:hypothetical protein